MRQRPPQNKETEPVSKTIHRYQFEPDVPIEEAEVSLAMAIIAAEALYGQPAVRLSLRYHLSEEKRACAIDGDNDVARDVILIFTQFLIREFGENSFRVTRETHPSTAPARSPKAAAGRAKPGAAGCGACKARGKGVRA